MACFKYLLFNAVETNWSGIGCNGTYVNGTIPGGEAQYTNCLESGTLTFSRGAVILEVSDCKTSPIECGQGITESGYYYTDCCGNFIEGKLSGQTVTLNYLLPHNGIQILNVPGTQS